MLPNIGHGCARDTLRQPSLMPRASRRRRPRSDRELLSRRVSYSVRASRFLANRPGVSAFRSVFVCALGADDVAGGRELALSLADLSVACSGRRPDDLAA